MKNIYSLSTLILSSSLSISALAAAPQNGSLTLAGLKAKCVELSGNEQLKPFKALVSCQQYSTEWRVSVQKADPIVLKNATKIGASFALKGYSVPFRAEEVLAPSTEVGCQQLDQYGLTVPSVDIELDCAALSTVDSLAAFCGPLIEERLKADPSLQIEEATGMSLNSCQGAIDQTPEQGPGQS